MEIKEIKKMTFFISLLILIIFCYGEFINPIINIYQAEKKGQEELAQANFNRKIKVKEAEAFLESSQSLAEAEIVRARGVAEANKIIGDSLKGNESYLRYLWIQGLQTNHMQTVYVPTEAGLPILEANPNIRK